MRWTKVTRAQFIKREIISIRVACVVRVDGNRFEQISVLLVHGDASFPFAIRVHGAWHNRHLLAQHAFLIDKREGDEVAEAYEHDHE